MTMPTGFELLATRSDIAELETRLDRRFERIDERFERIDERFERIDEQFERIDRRFETFDHRFETLDHRFETLEIGLRSEIRGALHEQSTRFATWMMGGYMLVVAAVTLVVSVGA